MGYTTKTLEEMSCLDDFLINAVAEDPEVGTAFCKRLLSGLLQQELGEIRVTVQHAIQGETPDRKGIRLDVEVEELAGEEGRVKKIYDVEPHLRDGLDFWRHNRFFHARIDGKNLKSGEKDYSRLPDLCIITIMNYDPLGYDRLVYTVRNRCEEEAGAECPDGLNFLYFYTNGTRGGSEELRTLLRYLQHSTEENAVDDVTRELHRYVSKVKARPGMEERLMDFEEYVWYLKKEVEKETTERVEKETTERVEKETAERTMRDNIMGFLEEYGQIPEQLRQALAQTSDSGLLKRYLKLAARVNSVGEFMNGMETMG
ncbi:MAG: hypothetical protein NC541_08360 [bacterium]|nr:hypothetical protein [bacterium]